MSLEGISEVEKYMRKIKREMPKMLDAMMGEVLTTIVGLVNDGKNVFEQPFEPYSQSYQELRQKKGLRTTPNMQLTSSMINSLSVSRRRTSGGVYVRTIGVSGTGSDGVSNATKLRYLERHKNYKILFWSKRLMDIADKYWARI